MILSKLGRKKGARDQVVRNLATSLVLYGQITTTLAKAKTVAPLVNRVFNVAAKDTLASRRYVAKVLYDNKAIAKIFDIALPNLKKNKITGFTSIVRLSPRKGDGAQMAVIALNSKLYEIASPEPKSKTKIKTENSLSTPSKENVK